MLHQVLTSAIRANRQATADDLAEAGQVRANAEPFLRAAWAGPEPGNHFIEDQNRPVPLRKFAESCQKAGLRGDDSHVAREGLYDQRGHAMPVFLEQAVDRGEVVIPSHQGVGGDGT